MAGLIAAPCAGTAVSARAQGRDGVIVVAPATPSTQRSSKTSQVVSPPRLLLGERLGKATASSEIASPDPTLVPYADRIVPTDAAVRAYGSATVTVYRAGHEAVSSAIVRLARPEGATFADVGDGGWSSNSEIAFWRGPYAAVVAGGVDEERAGLAEALLDRMGAVSAPAPLLDHLPDVGQVAGSRRFAPTFETLRRLRPDLTDDVFRLDAGGAEATVAEYEQAGGKPFRLTLVEYQTPQLAAAADRHVKAWFESLPADVKAHRILKRVGNYIVEATDIQDPATAEAVVGAVDYSYKIDWLKEPPTPPRFDMAGESQKVAQVIISSFGIVGLGLLFALTIGTIFGAEMFRRRRRAVGKSFSDAGGMVCLDLDPALPPTAGPVALLTERAIGDD